MLFQLLFLLESVYLPFFVFVEDCTGKNERMLAFSFTMLVVSFFTFFSSLSNTMCTTFCAFYFLMVALRSGAVGVLRQLIKK